MAIAGVRLNSKIAQVAPNSLLEIAPKPVPSSAQLPPLSLGQAVEAEIVDELADGLVLVNIAGAFLTAEASDALPLGGRFAARVEQLQPQVVLRVLVGTEEGDESEDGSNVQAEAAKLLRAAIPHHASAAESLRELTQELASFIEHSPQESIPPNLLKLQNLIKTILPEQGPPTAVQLAAFIRDSGLQYESKLLHAAESSPQDLLHVAEKDLKGVLLQSLLCHGAEEFESIASSITHHLEHIESQQAMNILAQAKGAPCQLQIPLFIGQSMATTYLSIERDGSGAGEREKREKGEEYNILFALDLEHFGQTRIDARIGPQSLWAAFYVDQPESVALLQRELPGFRLTLQSLGYADVLLTAKPFRQLAPEKREKFEALTIGVPASIHLLDTKA
ncbi:MAG: hypothetical protein HY267_00090 [Deltaproteobacteria bacterium]|nr:hypothetical protein [Deltaproteobacteria bacterium]